LPIRLLSFRNPFAAALFFATVAIAMCKRPVDVAREHPAIATAGPIVGWAPRHSPGGSDPSLFPEDGPSCPGSSVEELSLASKLAMAATVLLALTLTALIPVRMETVAICGHDAYGYPALCTIIVTTYPLQGFALVMFCLGMVTMATAVGVGLNKGLLTAMRRNLRGNAGLCMSTAGIACGAAGYTLTRVCTTSLSLICIEHEHASLGFAAIALGAVLYGAGLILVRSDQRFRNLILAFLVIATGLVMVAIMGLSSTDGLGTYAWGRSDSIALGYLFIGAVLVVAGTFILAARPEGRLLSVVVLGIAFGYTAPADFAVIDCLSPSNSTCMLGTLGYVSLLALVLEVTTLLFAIASRPPPRTEGPRDGRSDAT